MSKSKMLIRNDREEKSMWDMIISKDVIQHFDKDQNEVFIETRDGFKFPRLSNIRVKYQSWVSYGSRHRDNLMKEICESDLTHGILCHNDHDLHKIFEDENKNLKGNPVLPSSKRYTHSIQILEVEVMKDNRDDFHCKEDERTIILEEFKPYGYRS